MPRAAIFVLLLSLGRLARAQPAGPAPDNGANAAEAAELYDDGKRHFDIGEYAQAIASWKQSYLRSNAPLLLFNIAQAYRLSNNCAEANRFYLNYRRIEKHPKNQAELDQAMARCAGITPATGAPATSGPPASPATTADTGPRATTADAAQPATGAASPRSEPPPGPAGSTGSPPDHPPVAASTAAAPADPPALQPSHRGGTWRTAGLVSGAAGVTALVASGLYAIGASHDSSTVSSTAAGTAYQGDVASTDHSGKTAAHRAQVLLGIGAVLAVAGGAMWYVGHQQAGAQVGVAVAPGHGEVMWSCAF